MAMQGSDAFDVEAVMRSLEGEELLIYEKAILCGKVSLSSTHQCTFR